VLKGCTRLARKTRDGLCKASISPPHKCHLRNIVIIRTITFALDFQESVQKRSSTSAGGQHFPCCRSVSPSFSGITEACQSSGIAPSSANTALKPCLRERVTGPQQGSVNSVYILYATFPMQSAQKQKQEHTASRESSWRRNSSQCKNVEAEEAARFHRLLSSGPKGADNNCCRSRNNTDFLQYGKKKKKKREHLLVDA